MRQNAHTWFLGQTPIKMLLKWIFLCAKYASVQCVHVSAFFQKIFCSLAICLDKNLQYFYFAVSDKADLYPFFKECHE